MTSTFLGYQIYANDLTRSLQRTANEPLNKNAKSYFDANIGKVKSADDFINNYRLFSYAMKAYGLEDLTYAKGLMKKVITSDLSDPTSTANRLADPRYLAFAKAFNFSTTGPVTATSIQTDAQQSDTETQFATNMIGQLDAETIAEASSYYQDHIGSVTSFAALESDPKLYSYVLSAYGLSAQTPPSFAESLVQGSLSDPKSALNQTPGAGYLALAQDFSVDSSGKAKTTSVVQTSDEVTATEKAFMKAVNPQSTSTLQAAQAENQYYNDTINTVTSVTKLLADNRLKAYVIKAYGLPSGIDNTTLNAILTSDPTDPNSYAATSGNATYQELAGAFNFAGDGSVKAVTQIQSANKTQATVALYAARATADTTSLVQETQYYEQHIGTVASLADLEKDSRLYNYVLQAYGIASSTPNTTVEAILEGTPDDNNAAIGKTSGSHDLAFARAFTIDGAGNATDHLQALSPDAITAATTAYMAASAPDTASQATASTESRYFASAVTKAVSVNDLLSDSRVVSFIIKAYGLPKATSTSQLAQALTSDTTSASSAANRLGGNFPQLAKAFNFGTNGLLAHQGPNKAQSKTQIAATDATFNEQAMEDEAGQQNTGIQLALYFKRMAPTVTNSYQILADKALTQVFQTILGLSSNSSKADIDSQARYFTSKIKFTDLKDPTKVNRMVQRFAALYDVAHPDTTAQSDMALLFGSASSGLTL